MPLILTWLHVQLEFAENLQTCEIICLKRMDFNGHKRFQKRRCRGGLKVMAFISLNWEESVKQYFAASAKSQSKDQEIINFKYTVCV